MIEIAQKLWEIGLNNEENHFSEKFQLIVDLATLIVSACSVLAIALIWASNRRLLMRQIEGAAPVLNWKLHEGHIATVTFLNPRTYPLILKDIRLSLTWMDVVNLKTGIKYPNYRGVTYIMIDEAVPANHFLEQRLKLDVEGSDWARAHRFWVGAEYFDPHEKKIILIETEGELPVKELGPSYN